MNKPTCVFFLPLLTRRSVLIHDTVQKFWSLTKSRSSCTSSVTIATDETDAPISDQNQNAEKRSGALNDVEGSPKKRPKKVTVEDTDADAKLECVGVCIEESSKYCCRRDSVLGDAKAMEHVAKITQMFVTPVKTAPKKVSKETSHAFMRQMSIEDVENEQTHLCPKVEGRIIRADLKVNNHAVIGHASLAREIYTSKIITRFEERTELLISYLIYHLIDNITLKESNIDY